jgi:hypothetical protein
MRFGGKSLHLKRRPFMPDHGKPRILFQINNSCQSLFCTQPKKSATRESRAKSTPKEEGGGDKLWTAKQQILKLNELSGRREQRSSFFCASRHLFFL